MLKKEYVKRYHSNISTSKPVGRAAINVKKYPQFESGYGMTISILRDTLNMALQFLVMFLIR